MGTVWEVTGRQQIARRHSVGSAALARCVTAPRAGSVLGEPRREVCLPVPCDTELRDLQVFLARAQCVFSRNVCRGCSRPRNKRCVYIHMHIYMSNAN